MTKASKLDFLAWASWERQWCVTVASDCTVVSDMHAKVCEHSGPDVGMGESALAGDPAAHAAHAAHSCQIERLAPWGESE